MREVNLATEAIRSSDSGIIRSIEQLPARLVNGLAIQRKIYADAYIDDKAVHYCNIGRLEDLLV